LIGHNKLKGIAMKKSVSPTLKARYVVDSKGKKTGVLLDIKLFERLLEELEDLYDITKAERIIEKKGKRYTLKEVEQSLSAKE